MKPTWQTADGRIKLFLGDCLEVLPTLEAGSVDAVVTDPPYGINGGRGGDRKLGKADYGECSWPDTREYIRETVVPAVVMSVRMAKRSAVTPGVFCMWDYPEPAGLGCFWLPAAVTHGPWGFNCLTPILYYGRDHRSGVGQLPSGISVVESSESNGHPCPKPIRAWRWLVEKLSSPGETVLDPFMGSGTTGVACAKLSRGFVGVEIEPRYFDIAVRRIEAELSRMPLFETPPEVLVNRELFTD